MIQIFVDRCNFRIGDGIGFCSLRQQIEQSILAVGRMCADSNYEKIRTSIFELNLFSPSLIFFQNINTSLLYSFNN